MRYLSEYKQLVITQDRDKYMCVYEPVLYLKKKILLDYMREVT